MCIVQVRVTRFALVAHRNTYASPRWRHTEGLLFPLSIFLEWSGWPRIWWCGIGGFQEQVQCLFVGLVALSFLGFNYFPFLFFSSIGWLCGAGVFGLIGCQSPSPGLALPIFFNNNNGCRSSSMSKSDRSRWKFTEQTWFEFELTLYNIHSAATWHRWHNDKKIWSGQSQATEYTFRSRS